MTEIKQEANSIYSYNIIMHDLESLRLYQNKDNQHHYRELKKNINALFGIKRNEREEICARLQKAIEKIEMYEKLLERLKAQDKKTYNSLIGENENE